jgi:hypothetical protein
MVALRCSIAPEEEGLGAAVVRYLGPVAKVDLTYKMVEGAGEEGQDKKAGRRNSAAKAAPPPRKAVQEEPLEGGSKRRGSGREAVESRLPTRETTTEATTATMRRGKRSKPVT